MTYPIPSGVWLQIYLAKVQGDLSRALLTLPQSIAGVVFHGGPETIADRWEALDHAARTAGLAYGVSWGLDGQTDAQGHLRTAEQTGRLLGATLLQEGVSFGLLDAEGAWETDTGPSDQSTPAKVDELCSTLRAVAPHAIVGDQSWFAQESHYSFPDSRFAKYVDFRAPQFYCNDFKGADRYRRIFAWGEHDWLEHEQFLRAKDPALVRPRTVTIQGYGWGGIDADLRACLSRAKDAPVIVWCEPWPDAQVLAALGAS